jgi:MoaA/NifB/PqqE/SkfB family radical SAM enzyme
MEKAHTSIVSKRLSKWWISLGMAISVFIIALRLYPPVKAIKVLAQINRRKRIIQGINGIPKFFRTGSRVFFELHTPGYPSPAINKFFKTELRKNIKGVTDTERIQNVVISITGKCRLNCKHCFEWERLGEDEKLTSTELSAISRSFQDAGASIIQVSGGEPLERFADACSLAREGSGKTDFWLLTSGYGLDHLKAELLKYSGYTGVNIGLEHWDPEKHNAFRGDDNSFRWVIEAAKNTINSVLVLALSLCATREFVNRENLEKYIELARELKASFIQILEPRETGRYKDMDISLSHEQRKLISDFYIAVNNSKKYRSYPTITYHGKFQRSHGCLGASSRFMYIDTNGDAHACPFCQDPVGNIMESSLDEIILKTKMRGCHLFKEYQE